MHVNIVYSAINFKIMLWLNLECQSFSLSIARFFFIEIFWGFLFFIQFAILAVTIYKSHNVYHVMNVILNIQSSQEFFVVAAALFYQCDKSVRKIVRGSGTELEWCHFRLAINLMENCVSHKLSLHTHIRRIEAEAYKNSVFVVEAIWNRAQAPSYSKQKKKEWKQERKRNEHIYIIFFFESIELSIELKWNHMYTHRRTHRRMSKSYSFLQ